MSITIKVVSSNAALARCTRYNIFILPHRNLKGITIRKQGHFINSVQYKWLSAQLWSVRSYLWIIYHI